MADEVTDEEIKTAILNNLTVPVWPHAGRALGLSRNSTYEGARRGEIPTFRVGGRIGAPTASLRRMLGLEPAVGNAAQNRESP
jgi:hypothetical protein